MTNKKGVEDLPQSISDEASLQNGTLDWEFIAAVRQGLSELNNGDIFPIEEVEKALPSWITKT